MTEDDAWRQIVENYGDAPSIEDIAAQERRSATPSPKPAVEPAYDEVAVEPSDEGYVPELEPIPRPEPLVGMAWFGVLGTPMVLLGLLLTGLPAPAWLGWLMVVWFLGGFAFLVARMPKQRDDPFDDGARL